MARELRAIRRELADGFAATSAGFTAGFAAMATKEAMEAGFALGREDARAVARAAASTGQAVLTLAGTRLARG